MSILRIEPVAAFVCPSWCDTCRIDPDNGGGWHRTMLTVDGFKLEISQFISGTLAGIETHRAMFDLDFTEVEAGDARRLSAALIAAAILCERIDAEVKS